MFKHIRRHLGWKLFLSYLLVVLVGAVVLIVAMNFTFPRALERHLTTMQQDLTAVDEHAMMGGGTMAGDLILNFSTAASEATLIALATASIIAISVSALITRRVVTPLLAMMAASQQIAGGNYGRRVPLPSKRPPADQDEMGQLAHSFNQMAEQLEESDMIRRQLIGDVTHELRTPLTIIKGSMEGLIDGVLPPEMETFQQVYHEAARLERLVTDLQELSQVEAGAYELHRQPVDLGKLTTAVADRLRPQFTDQGVALSVHLPPRLVMVSADPDRVSQILINLMGNALQHTPTDGQVDVIVQANHEGAVISIIDSGEGIGAQDLPHLFTRFYRIDKSRARSSGGSGIGLTIARHLVEAHGGRIWAESVGVGQGSTFAFSLPTSTDQISQSS